MTVYSPILPSEWDQDSPIKQTSIRKLEYNPRAICEGDASAPDFLAGAIEQFDIHGDKLVNNTISQAKLSNDAINKVALETGGVHQDELAGVFGALQTNSRYDGAAFFGSAFAIPSGQYLLGVLTYLNAPGVGSYKWSMGYFPWSRFAIGFNITSLITWMWMGMNPTGWNAAHLAWIIWVYITASPPYDLGHGDIPLFVYLDRGAANGHQSASITIDPPWFNLKNYPGITKGPGGLAFPEEEGQEGPISWDKARESTAAMQAHLERMRALERGEIGYWRPLDREQKNRGSTERPHPFADTSGEPILLDPGSDYVLALSELWKAGEREGLDELLTKALKVGDKIDYAGKLLPGVSVRKAGWR